MEEIVDRAFVGTCDICKEKIFTEVHEGTVFLPVLKNYTNCKKCGKLLCKNCVKVKRIKLHREYYCPDCII